MFYVRAPCKIPKSNWSSGPSAGASPWQFHQTLAVCRTRILIKSNTLARFATMFFCTSATVGIPGDGIMGGTMVRLRKYVTLGPCPDRWLICATPFPANRQVSSPHILLFSIAPWPIVPLCSISESRDDSIGALLLFQRDVNHPADFSLHCHSRWH